MVEVPIGSIVAYGGILDNEEFEHANSGWMLCDGRRLNRNDFSDLFNAIGFSWGGDRAARFNLPDLRGFFLRGVDNGTHRDAESESRLAILPGGATGDAPGSWQDRATALPRKEPFVATQTGSHQHAMDFQLGAKRDVDDTSNTVAHPAFSPQSKPKTDTEGAHHHDIAGGDRETHPLNAYVHWIIRVF